MDGKRRTIEVDEAVAVALEERAAERDMSVDALLFDYVAQDVPLVLPPDELAELESRLKDWEETRLGVPAEEVFDWMRSWGTENELPPPRPRRL